MSTKDNLQAAFAGESQANRKYLAFAKRADEEGYPQIARLFRAAAEAETIHAHNHLGVMGGIGSTADNLKAAVEGESYEFSEMYPKFIQEAKAEDEDDARISFYGANEVEKIHHQLFTEALDHLGNDADVDYYVCQVCGNTVAGRPPHICPICGQPEHNFKKVE